MSTGVPLDINVASAMQAIPCASQQVMINKEKFLAFIVDVVITTRGKESKSDVVKYVAEAASRFLDGGECSPQELNNHYVAVKEKGERQAKANNTERGGKVRSSSLGEAEEIMEDGGGGGNEDDDDEDDGDD